jgi:hypothetical protein
MNMLMDFGYHKISKCRWEDNVTWMLKELGCQAAMNMLMGFGYHKMQGISCFGKKLLHFSRRALPHGVKFLIPC